MSQISVNIRTQHVADLILYFEDILNSFLEDILLMFSFVLEVQILSYIYLYIFQIMYYTPILETYSTFNKNSPRNTYINLLYILYLIFKYI